MVRKVRTGGGGRGPIQTYDNTYSVYGPTRADSIGYAPGNPSTYRNAQATAFTSAKEILKRGFKYAKDET